MRLVVLRNTPSLQHGCRVIEIIQSLHSVQSSMLLSHFDFISGNSVAVSRSSAIIGCRYGNSYGGGERYPTHRKVSF